jgi:hypothetical protein
MNRIGMKQFRKFDQRVASQQLCKHGPTRNNRGGCVLRVRGDVTERWVVVTWHVFTVMLARFLAI